MAAIDQAAPEGPVLASVDVADVGFRAAIALADRYLPLAALLQELPATLTDIVRLWDSHADAVEALLTSEDVAHRVASEGLPLDTAAVGAPVLGGQTYCAIGNFRGQLAQAATDELGDEDDSDQVRRELESGWRARRATGAPYVAATGTARIAGPFDPLGVAAGLRTLDWEVELAAVIGRPGRQLRPERALEVVAGYSVANDVTLRDAVFRSDVPSLGADWLACKGRSGWLPLGPWLVPTSRVPDPDSLGLELRLNGRTMQADRTSDMLFDVAEVIAHVSQHTELRPGDVVCTGSPAGFGAHYGRFLRPGDVLEAGIEGLGVQRVRVVAEPDRAAPHPVCPPSD